MRKLEKDGEFFASGGKVEMGDLASKDSGGNMYLDRLKECPNIIEGESVCGSLVGTFGTNFKQTKHKHRCPTCGWESEEFDNVDGVF